MRSQIYVVNNIMKSHENREVMFDANIINYTTYRYLCFAQHNKVITLFNLITPISGCFMRDIETMRAGAVGLGSRS